MGECGMQCIPVEMRVQIPEGYCEPIHVKVNSNPARPMRFGAI